MTGQIPGKGKVSNEFGRTKKKSCFFCRWEEIEPTNIGAKPYSLIFFFSFSFFVTSNDLLLPLLFSLVNLEKTEFEVTGIVWTKSNLSFKQLCLVFKRGFPFLRSSNLFYYKFAFVKLRIIVGNSFKWIFS